MKNLLKLLHKRKSSAGYTLAELLIASTMTLTVIGAAGFGIVSVMNNNKTAKAQIDRRTEVNRAIDFISNEVRQASLISNDASGTGFTPDADDTVVMVLDIPGSRTAVYYLSDPSPTWQGPQVLSRWGPPLNDNGAYGTGSNISQALIDQVIANDPGSPPTCQAGWSASGATGFYVCIDDSDGNGQGEMAQLNITASVDNGETYEARTNVFARAETNPGVGGVNLGALTSTPTSTSGETNEEGEITKTFEILGSEYACNNATMWRVKTEITRVDESGTPLASSDERPNPVAMYPDSPPATLVLNEGEDVVVKSIPENLGGALCFNAANEVSSADSTDKVKILENGDSLDDIPGFENQDSVTEVLKDYLSDGQANLADDQTLYLFEIGQTDTTAPGFDMQDNIVLVTTENSSDE